MKKLNDRYVERRLDRVSFLFLYDYSIGYVLEKKLLIEYIRVERCKILMKRVDFFYK